MTTSRIVSYGLTYFTIRLSLTNISFNYLYSCYGNKCVCTETLVMETSVNVQRPLLQNQVFMYRDPCYGNKCVCTESGTCWSTLNNHTSTYTYTFDTKQIVLINILAYQNSYNGYSRKLQMK